MIMPKFQKGLETQRKILKISKELFYQKGYAKTSIKEISELANSGSFAYFYKTKEDLVSVIYAELLMNTYSFIRKKTSRQMSSIEKNTLSTFLYFGAILADKNTIAFHKEILNREPVTRYIGHHIARFYGQFMNELKSDIDERELKAIQLAEFGLRRELVSDFIENPQDNSIEDIVIKMHLFRARLFKMDENLMRAYLFNAHEFVRSHDCSEVRFLV